MLRLSGDTTIFRQYSKARSDFLKSIGCDDSCRDPLAEFAERLVCEQMKGLLAPSRVQKGYDLTTPEGRRVQVKYLANPIGRWRNEHLVSFNGEADEYAVVVFEGLEIRAIVIFQAENMAAICRALGKKHSNQETTLQLTQVNFRRLLERAEEFERLGLKIFVAAIPE